MKLKTIILFNGLLYLTISANAQTSPLQKGDLLLQGYQKTVSGATVDHGSHLPYANRALIVQTTEGDKTIEWETEALPAQISAGNVTFVWIAGESGVMYGKVPATVDLFVNGQKKFTVTTGSMNAWDKNSADGWRLSFRPMMNTRNEDRIGYMYLRAPKKQLNAGTPLQLRMVGSNAGTDSWCMVFESPIKSEIQATPLTAILKNAQRLTQPILLDIHYFGAPTTAKITVGGVTKRVPLSLGYNAADVPVEPVTETQNVALEIDIDGKVQKQEITLQPIRNWKVNFVQHTHTDIGYTRSQTEILAEHIRFIDYALDYCDATDSWAEEDRFRWTCEASWAVSEYLKWRPAEQIARLKKRVDEGRIEITGMYFNFNEMPDEQTLAASLYPIQQFREAGLKVETAMQNDVNGIGWCFSEFFPDMGIKYLNMGTHGHKALISFDIPTAFWWESPSGKKTLTFRAEHYMYGNFFGIEKDDFAAFEKKMFEYLNSMEAKNYPFDIVSLQYSGYFTDNAPPATAGQALIRKWNEKYEWPKMRSAIPSDFFKEVAQQYGNTLPSIRGAWPDWWNDGFGSGAREGATSRLAHSDIIANQIALSLAKMLGSKLPEGINHEINEVNKALLFYDEHTFGYHASVNDPFGKNTMEQRSLKMSYAWEAYRRSRPIGEAALGLLQMYIPPADVPSITVFNPHNWKHSGLAEAYIDHEILPRNKKVEIIDEAGNIIPAQAVESHSDGTYWSFWVTDVPALGYRQYFIRIKNDPPVTLATSANLEQTTVENQWYRLTINPDKGTISHLFDKELNRDILSGDTEWQLGEFIYETLDSRPSSSTQQYPKAKRRGLEKVWFERYNEGAIWDSWVFRGETEAGIGEKNYMLEVRVFKTAKRIDFVHLLKKKQVVDPEAVYVSFPFELTDGKIYYDVPGGVIQAGIDQIPASSNDWNNIQNFATVRNADGQLLMGSQEVSLVQFGGFNIGRFKDNSTPETNHIFSWPMNNHWNTNFNADQHGEFRWTYFLTSSLDNSIEFASKFAWGARIPLPTRVLQAGSNGVKGKTSGAVLEIKPDNVLLVNMRPVENEKAILMQIREIGGKETTFEAASPVLGNIAFEPCDANGNRIEQTGQITLKPWENKFIKVKWQ